MALPILECQLISVHSHKAFDLLDDKVVIRNSSSAAVNQQWRVVPLQGEKDDAGQRIEHEEYAIESLASEGEGLTASGGSRGAIFLSAYAGSADQRWRIVPAENHQGQYRIENVHTRKVLDCWFAHTNDGTNVIPYTYHGGAHQRWRLTPLQGLWAWGFNSEGQLGHGTRTSRDAPGKIPRPLRAGIRAVSAGGYHTLVLLEGGTVWSWGSQDHYQLGNSPWVDRLEPARVADLEGVTAIAAGGWHNLALCQDGTVRAWGLDRQGQLGRGRFSGSGYQPTEVVGLKGVIAVSAGGEHSLALMGDGTVRAWGTQDWYQLGNPTWRDRAEPVAVPELSGVKVDSGESLHGPPIAAGAWHSVVLMGDGTVRSWGANNYGQLGSGTTWGNKYSPPAQAGDLDAITAVAVGSHHSLALREDGTVWAWGANGYGQLGDGTNQHRHQPVPVESLENVKAIAAGKADGSHHSVALREDGTVWAWGANSYGQLGDGTKQHRNRPVQVPGMRGVSIAAGGFHTVAYGWPLTVSGSPSPSAVKAGYSDKTVKELREDLRTRDLKVSGQKQELVDRLERHDVDAIAETAETEAAEAEAAEAEAAEAEAAEAEAAEAHTEEPRDDSRSPDLDVSAVKDDLMARLRGRGDADVSDGRWLSRAAPTAGQHTARQRATDRLVQVIGQHEYPSHQILDRLERSLRTPSDLEAYSWILSKITENQRYPSLRLLDRLDACALAHELTALNQGTATTEGSPQCGPLR